jgi:hypothetical protein
MKQLILILLLALIACSEEPIVISDIDRCKLHFHADRDQKETMYAQTYSESRPDTNLEVWAGNAQSSRLPIPGMFLKIASNELDSGTHWGTKWRKVYQLKADQDYKYVWLQLRTINSCGASEFQTVLVRVGFGLQEN